MMGRRAREASAALAVRVRPLNEQADVGETEPAVTPLDNQTVLVLRNDSFAFDRVPPA